MMSFEQPVTSFMRLEQVRLWCSLGVDPTMASPNAVWYGYCQ